MLNLLLLEDVDTDAYLVMHTLKQSGMDFKAVVAKGKADFVEALGTVKFDAILADNSLPQFSASEALEIYRAKNLKIPFILVTGSISEEYAVDIMKQGAWDYILKDRLQRLPSAVLSSIHKFEIEEERIKYLDKIIANEAMFKEAARLAHFGSWEADLINYTQQWTDEQFLILGYAPGEIEPSIANFLKCVHPEDINYIKRKLDDAFHSPDKQKFDCRLIDKNDAVKYIYGEMAVKRDENGKALRINGFTRDVTESKIAEIKEKKITEDLIQRNNDLEQFTYIVSHNLRAPVANIIGVSEILKSDMLRDDEVKDFVNSLFTSVQKLDTVIMDLNNVLQVRQHVNENKELVHFSDIVVEVRSVLENVVRDQEVKLITDFSEIDAMFTIKSYMHSVFYNIISNSIKFRQAATVPVIEIYSHLLTDKIVLTFKDNGIGIDLEKRGSQVFGLYKRFHQGYAEGKGMGLFMVKTQVESMGGKIKLDSKVNEGTKFVISFDI